MKRVYIAIDMSVLQFIINKNQSRSQSIQEQCDLLEPSPFL